MLFTRYTFIIFLLLFSAVVFSQQEKQYAFTHFNTANGLVSNSVFDVLQDKQGYIWLATVDGLQRYDGNRFITFRHSNNDPNTILGNFVTQLTEDKDGNLWIYDGSKIGFFDTKNFNFKTVNIEGEDANNPYDILFYGKAANGYVALFVQNKGIFIYDPASKIFKLNIAFKLPEKKRVYSVQSIDSGRSFWISSFGGLIIYNTETGNLNYRGHNPDNNIYINYIGKDTSIAFFYNAVNDTLWYGNWPLAPYAPFIHKLNLKTGENKTYSVSKQFHFGYVEIAGALFQQNGRKWFYGRSFIGEYTNNDTAPFQLIPNGYTGEQSISFDRVYNMKEDRQHNIWVATDNGVYVFNPDMQFFNNYKPKRATDKQATYAATDNACELKNGNVFITTWGSGLYYYDNKFNVLPLPHGLQELSKTYMMWCVHEHSKSGLIWMGMQFGEMAVYDPLKDKLEVLKDPAFNGKTIRQMTEDAYGNLWFGLQSGGVVKWDTQAAQGDIHKGYKIIKEKGPYYIQTMYTGKDGAVWAGYLNGGLDKYDAATNKLLAHYTKNNTGNGLWDNSVNDVYQYNDSIVLIADGALDMLNIKTNKITHISTENGLPSNTVLSVEADSKGILWLGMANQLCRFDLQRKIFSTFDRRDGISYDLFNVAGDYKMKDGRLVYLTDKNFIVFKPEAVSAMAKPNDVAITAFTLENNALLVDSLRKFQTIDLKYNNTSVTIEFSALNYTPQNKLHYYYMMDGLDKDWMLSSNLNEAVYNYLPAGNYTFKVKAKNSEGKESSITQLHLRVIPPFWQTWWFLGLLALTAIAVFYLFDRERIRKLQALQKMRTQIAGNLHENVNATLNNINLLSEMAKIKAGKDVERSKEYIDQITEKSRRMIDVMDDMLWSLKPENDSMEKTVLRMQEYAEGLQHTYETKIKMHVDEKVKAIKPDMKTRHEIFFIFKEVITGLSKQANGTESLIDIDLLNDKLLLKVQNTDIHFITGADTASVKKEILQHAHSINAELDIQHDSKGVSVILLVPVKYF